MQSILEVGSEQLKKNLSLGNSMRALCPHCFSCYFCNHLSMLLFFRVWLVFF